MNEHTNKWINGLSKERRRQTGGRRTDEGRTDGRAKDGSVDEPKDGPTNGRTDGRTKRTNERWNELAETNERRVN